LSNSLVTIVAVVAIDEVVDVVHDQDQDHHAVDMIDVMNDVVVVTVEADVVADAAAVDDHIEPHGQ